MGSRATKCMETPEQIIEREKREEREERRNRQLRNAREQLNKSVNNMVETRPSHPAKNQVWKGINYGGAKKYRKKYTRKTKKRNKQTKKRKRKRKTKKRKN